MNTAKFECQNLKCPDSYVEKVLAVSSPKIPSCIICAENLVLIPEKSSLALNTRGCSGGSNPFTH